MIVIIPLILWLVGVNLNITEGFRSAAQKRRSNRQKAAKKTAAKVNAARAASKKAVKVRTASTRNTGRQKARITGRQKARNKGVKCGDYNWTFFVSFILIIPTLAALKQIPFLIISGINGMFCISKMKTDTPEKVKERSKLLKKLSFVSTYGIIIFIGMIILPIIIHMLRNITQRIKFKFLTDLLNKLEDLIKIK
jgi:hypothetical protein